jgi:hypothetical protein
MGRIIVGLLLCSLALSAADVTGTWTGSLKAAREDGSEHTDSAYVVLKQQGNTVTGFAGGSPDDQHSIQNGKLEGDQLTFEIGMGERIMRIALKLSEDGNAMTGKIQRERNGVTQTAQLQLSRAR